MKANTVKTTVCRPDDLTKEIRDQLVSSPDHTCLKDNTVYLLIDHTVLCLPDDPGRNELLYALARLQKNNSERPENKTDIYEKILKNRDYQPDPETLRKFGMRFNRKSCCVVFRSFMTIDKDLYTLLSDMAPVEAEDILIPADYQSTVLIKDHEIQSEEEIREFTEAVIGTLETEGITDIHAGIGRICADIPGLRRSFDEANQALKIGYRHHRQERVHGFEDQMLERIVDSIPEEQKMTILRSFQGSLSAKGLSPEMLETVRVFFQNDLNMTAASKQLFIHRNTLNYRLDKIKKDYGLDLRTFRDAVIFRIISEIACDTQTTD